VLVKGRVVDIVETPRNISKKGKEDLIILSSKTTVNYLLVR